MRRDAQARERNVWETHLIWIFYCFRQFGIKTSEEEEFEYIFSFHSGEKEEVEAILSFASSNEHDSHFFLNPLHSSPFPSTTTTTHTHSSFDCMTIKYLFLKWVKSIKKYKCRIPPNLCSLTEYFQYKTCRFLHKYLIPHYGSVSYGDGWKEEESITQIVVR